MAFIVSPDINPNTNQMILPTEELNFFMADQYQSNFDFYQGQFSVYSWMKLNKKQKFVLNRMSGNPLIWQSQNSCAWNPTQSISMGQQEFEPCAVEINEEYCHDEKIESSMEVMLEWSDNPGVDVDEAGEKIVDAMVQTIVQNAVLGFKGNLTAGQSYNPEAIDFTADTPANIVQLFTNSMNACRGWVELLKVKANDQGYDHLNYSDAILDANADGVKYTGDIVTLYDALFAEAKPELQDFVKEGGVVGPLAQVLPVFMLTPQLWLRLTIEYTEQQHSSPVITPRITIREFTYNVNGRQTPVHVYYIDQTPVVKVNDFKMYDKYMNGSTYLAAITSAGNIQLGGSFDNLPTVNNGVLDGTGFLVEQSARAKDYGRYYVLSNALMANTIADTNFIVAAQKFVEKAS